MDINKEQGEFAMDEFKDGNNGRKNDHIDAGRISSGGAAAYHAKLPMWFIKSRNTIYYILSVIEVLLLMRFVFMLLGASRRSGFIAFLYDFTGIFTAPFQGIFYQYVAPGLASKSIFDPAAPIAMLVYALLAFGIVRLMWVKISRDGV